MIYDGKKSKVSRVVVVLVEQLTWFGYRTGSQPKCTLEQTKSRSSRPLIQSNHVGRRLLREVLVSSNAQSPVYSGHRS